MKCGLELPDDSQFCRKCGFAFPIAASQPSTTTTPVPEAVPSVTLSSVPATPAPARSTFNFGTFVFAGFSVLSLVVSFAKGIVPIYLGEAALWGVLAWFWHKKNPTNQLLNVGIVLLAVIVAAAQGFLIGRLPADSYAGRQGSSLQFGNPVESRKLDRLDTLVALKPKKLTLSCGVPLSDTKIHLKSVGEGRQLAFRGTGGSVITITFIKVNDYGIEADDKTWGFWQAFNGEGQYSVNSDIELEQLFAQLPCIPE
jgi:hypothetical protein